MHIDRFVVRDWPSGPSATLPSRCCEPWPALVELEGSPRRLRLRITEDALSYIVNAELDDTPSDGFDVELDGNRVHIVATDAQRQMRIAAPGIVPSTRDDPPWSRISLTFAERIDAVSSRGECGDGLLQLSLCKEAMHAGGPTPHALYEVDAPAAGRPVPMMCGL